MLTRLRSVRALAALLAAAPLAGCGSADDSAVSVVAIGKPAESFARGPRLPFAAQLVQASTVEGLVSFGEQAASSRRWPIAGSSPTTGKAISSGCATAPGAMARRFRRRPRALRSTRRLPRSGARRSASILRGSRKCARWPPG